MRRIIVNPDRPEAAAIAEAVEVLRSGGVVGYPTDTLYGLAVDPRSADAIERLFLLKSRDRHAALPLVAADLGQATTAGTFGPAERRAAAAFWPGPLTLVVPADASISPDALGGGATVAVRVPAHAVARALAAAFGCCVTATSANSSGHPATASPDTVASALPGLDLLLDGGAAAGGSPSTIISFDNDAPVLLRAGAIAWDRVLKSLK
jgi:L-threonylcarbamoyladenylate synthase